jgi:hypothetical protein
MLGPSGLRKERERLEQREQRMRELGLTGIEGVSIQNDIDELQHVGYELTAFAQLKSGQYTEYEARLGATILQLVEEWRAELKRRNGAA